MSPFAPPSQIKLQSTPLRLITHRVGYHHHIPNKRKWNHFFLKFSTSAIVAEFFKSLIFAQNFCLAGKTFKRAQLPSLLHGNFSLVFELRWRKYKQKLSWAIILTFPKVAMGFSVQTPACSIWPLTYAVIWRPCTRIVQLGVSRGTSTGRQTSCT